MKSKAIYAGSFDPIHLGHLDIIRRASQIFDLTVLVSHNPFKKYALSDIERTRLVSESIRGLGVRNIRIATLTHTNELVADYAFTNNYQVLIRGIRNIADYDFERMMRDVNVGVQSGVETVFLSASPSHTHISSTAVKELFSHGGFIHEYVPLVVKQALEYNNDQRIIGVTGNIASGKTHVSNELSKLDVFYKITHIDLDTISHEILVSDNAPSNAEVRRKIRDVFNLGATSTIPFTALDKSILGELIFNDDVKRQVLNDIMRQPILTALRQKLLPLKGIILISGALLVEFNLLHLCNNNVVLVTTSDENRHKRLKLRGLDDGQIRNRLKCQYSDAYKEKCIGNQIKMDNHGQLVVYENNTSYGKVSGLYDNIRQMVGVGV